MKKRQGGKVLRSEREAVPLSDFLRGPGGEKAGCVWPRGGR